MQPLSVDKVTWLKEVARRLDTDEPNDFRSVRAALDGKIANDFNPRDIKCIYLTPPCDLNLLGMKEFGNGARWVKITQDILQCIRAILKSEPKTDNIAAKRIAEMLKIEESEVRIGLGFLAQLGSFYSHAHGISDHFGLIEINLNEESFSEYMTWTNFDKLLERAQKRFKERIKYY